MPDLDAISIEHRLTSIENNTKSTLEQLVKLNGKVAVHESYINEQKLTAREVKGFAAGRMSIHKRDLAILGLGLGILQFVIGNLADITSFIKGL